MTDEYGHNEDFMTCKTCLYHDTTSFTAECHRYPPRAAASHTSKSEFPETGISDWCGEWEAATVELKAPFKEVVE